MLTLNNYGFLAANVSDLPIDVKIKQGDTMYLTLLNNGLLFAIHSREDRATSAMKAVSKTMREHALQGHGFKLCKAVVTAVGDSSSSLPWDYQISVELGEEVSREKT